MQKGSAVPWSYDPQCKNNVKTQCQNSAHGSQVILQRQWEGKGKDTVAEDDEHDKVDAVVHAAVFNSALRPDAIVHHVVPIFPRQDLHGAQKKGVKKYYNK